MNLRLFLFFLFVSKSLLAEQSISVEPTQLGGLTGDTPCVVADIQKIYPDFIVVRNRTKHYGAQQGNPILVAKSAIPNPILFLIIVPDAKNLQKIDHVVVMTPQVSTVFGVRIGDGFYKVKDILALDKCIHARGLDLKSTVLCPARLSTNIWYGFNGEVPIDNQTRPVDFGVISGDVLNKWRVHEIVWYAPK